MKLKNIIKASLVGLVGIVGTCNYLIDRINPPGWYDAEWNRMSEFMGIEIEQPRYFKVKGSSFPCIHHGDSLFPIKFEKNCIGLYVSGLRLLFLAEEWIDNTNNVREEMAHAYGRWNEDTDEILKRCQIDDLVLTNRHSR